MKNLEVLNSSDGTISDHIDKILIKTVKTISNLILRTFKSDQKLQYSHYSDAVTATYGLLLSTLVTTEKKQYTKT